MIGVVQRRPRFGGYGSFTVRPGAGCLHHRPVGLGLPRGRRGEQPTLLSAAPNHAVEVGEETARRGVLVPRAAGRGLCPARQSRAAGEVLLIALVRPVASQACKLQYLCKPINLRGIFHVGRCCRGRWACRDAAAAAGRSEGRGAARGIQPCARSWRVRRNRHRYRARAAAARLFPLLRSVTPRLISPHDAGAETMRKRRWRPATTRTPSWVLKHRAGP